jgi:arylsulfatase A-like enzyme
MRCLASLLLVWFACVLPVRAQSSAPVALPNVVVVVLDDVGFEDLVLTPLANLRQWAPAARIYARHYGAPVCSPSRYQAMFGRLPHRAFIGTALTTGPNEKGAPTTDISLPEILQARGYRTGLFGKWHLSGKKLGQQDESARVHGFQTWRAGIIGNLGSTGSHYAWERIDDGVTTSESTYTSRAIADEFAAWWTAQSGPRFAVVAFNAPHSPYESAAPSGMLPPGYTVVPTPRGHYESALVALDTAFGEMASFLDLSNTYVLLVSDNGSPTNALPPSMLERGYKGSTFEGGVRVPLLLWGVDTVPGIDTSLVQTVDIPATVLELVGLAPQSGFEDSHSFAPTRLGAPGSRPYVFTHIFSPNGGTSASLSNEAWAVVRADGLKLVDDFGTQYLFDLTQDPHEAIDLGVNNPAYFADVLALDAFRAATLGAAWPY